MAKTKAELAQENKILKAKLNGYQTSNENLRKRIQDTLDRNKKLEKQIEAYKAALQTVKESNDKLYKEKEELLDKAAKREAELKDAQEALEILQAKVAKIQYDEELVADAAYAAAEKKYNDVTDRIVAAHNVHIHRLNDKIETLEESLKMYTWIISRLYDLAQFAPVAEPDEDTEEED